MNFLVAKAEKRMHDEGKDTVFFSGTSQITRERIEQFKRRKISREFDKLFLEGGTCESISRNKSGANCSRDTPENITYYTPPEESPLSCLADAEAAERTSELALEPHEYVPSWFPYPRNGTSSFKTNQRETQLPTVLERSSKGGSREDSFSTLETIQTYRLSETDYNDGFDSKRYVYTVYYWALIST
jgi:hypothetical protein